MLLPAVLWNRSFQHPMKPGCQAHQDPGHRAALALVQRFGDLCRGLGINSLRFSGFAVSGRRVATQKLQKLHRITTSGFVA